MTPYDPLAFAPTSHINSGFTKTARLRAKTLDRAAGAPYKPRKLRTEKTCGAQFCYSYCRQAHQPGVGIPASMVRCPRALVALF